MKKASNENPILHDEAYEHVFREPSITHASHITLFDRNRELLNGTWFFTIDRFDTGLRQHWYKDIHLSASEREAPWDYDLAQGETVEVPSCWNFAKPEYFHYEGTSWYTRVFEHNTEEQSERIFLRIGAAHYETKVFLNGAYLGRHRGGSTPFYVELTEHLTDTNYLMLAVNNERKPARVPMRHFDWFNYGGVFRDVELIRLPHVFIQDVFVRLLPDAKTIAVDMTLSGKIDGIATIRIPELSVDESITIQNGAGSISIEKTPEYWSPETPKLYDMEVRYNDERIQDRIGFRTIATDGQSILLNGTQIKLRGIAVHEDDADMGRATSEEDIRRRFAHAKELGANFMRLAHYPHHEMAARIADEVGILLWEEVPVYWAIDFENPDTFDDANNQLSELILRDRNRASVIVWSVGNENADTDARLAFMQRLVETARTLDASRLVAAACLVNHQAKRMEDRLAEYLDLVGINEYYGWYEKNMDDLQEIGENYTLEKPIVITETGADARAGVHDTTKSMFSEEGMLECYEKQFAIIPKIKAIQGFCPWILYDFRSERRKNQFQEGWNRKGLVAQDKITKKLAFDAMAEFYRTIW